MTKEDIQRVYDDLEDDRIKTRNGTIFQDRSSYYNKIFKGKPFRLAGKDGLAEDVIESFKNSPRIVRYATEESFRKLVRVSRNPVHQLLLWLAWDIGENIQTLLALTREDFIAQVNRHSGEREYIVNLPASKLKRSRLTRSEVTLYPETTRLLDLVLPSAPLNDGYLFNSGYRAAAKVLAKAVQRSGASTMPHGEPVRWKDLRSGMACHLLRSGWTRDEVNARLGHAPNSNTLNAYINFLAIDREAPKQRLWSRETDQQERRDQAVVHDATAADKTKPSAGELDRLNREVSRLRGVIRFCLTDQLFGACTVALGLSIGYAGAREEAMDGPKQIEHWSWRAGQTRSPV